MQILEIFGINSSKFLRYFNKILEKIEKKILNNSRKINEILLGKIEVIRNRCCCYYEEILEIFSGIISVKVGKNYVEILEKI